MPLALELPSYGASVDAQNYMTAFDAAPSPMALVSVRDGQIWVVETNAAFRELYDIGADGEQRLGVVFRGASAEQVRRAVVQCLREGGPVALRVAHGSGAEVRILEVQVRRLDGPADRCVLLNVGPAPAALKLASLGEAGVLAEIGALSRGLVYIHDVERKILRFGEHSLLRRFGLQPGAMGVDDAVKLIVPEDRDVFFRALNRQVAAADGEVVDWVCRLSSQDGACIWAGIRTQVFARTPSGEVRRILGVATDETERFRHAAELAQAADALAHAEINERRRIGRELHDSTAQLLVAARLGLSKIARQTGLDDEAARALEDAREAIEDAQREIRNLAFVLHPPALQNQSLADALTSFAEGFARRTGLAIDVSADSRGGTLPFATQVALFRVTQEALMNVYRHAYAQRVSVRLMRRAGRTILEVEDDGVGIAGPNGIEAEGVGVSGMRARMKQIGGAFDLLPGKTGVLVRATVPTAYRARSRRTSARLPTRRLLSGEAQPQRAESA